MRQSDTIGALAEALSAAQGAATDAVMDSTNPAFRSRYASLSAVLAAVRGPLTANGLALTMAPIHADGYAGVEWLLAHKSGEWLAGEVTYRLAQDTPQGAGSATTYARRYTVSALGLIAADEDDDGNAGSAAPRAEPPKRPPAPRPTPPPVADPEPEPPARTYDTTPATAAQKNRLWALFAARNLNPASKDGRMRLATRILGPGWGESFAALTGGHVSAICDALEGPDALPDDIVHSVFEGR